MKHTQDEVRGWKLVKIDKQGMVIGNVGRNQNHYMLLLVKIVNASLSVALSAEHCIFVRIGLLIALICLLLKKYRQISLVYS